MVTTRKLLAEEWKATFDTFTKRHLRTPEEITIEVLSPDLGDQIEVRDAPLLGIDWDEKDRALEVVVDGLDHLAFEPSTIYVVQEDDGFIDSVQLVRPDGMIEVLQIRRVTSPVEELPSTT